MRAPRRGFRAGDEPQRLRLIADNLEMALKEVDARLASRPEQGTLLLAVARESVAAAVEGLPVPARLRSVGTA